MNFVQTLYIDPTKHPFTHSFGWLRPEYHLMGWALSCLQLQKLHGHVELYANSAGAELLIDTLRLPYTKVYTAHDDLKLADSRLWALPKLYTYSLQEEPFLHVDGDVFLFDQFSDQLLQSPLIVQNLEVATKYYTSTQKQLMDHFTYFPPCVQADFDSGMPINAVNAGILGGNNLQFIKQYTTEAFEYVNRNTKHFHDVNVDRFNVFFEQHLFYSLAKEQNIPINYLFEGLFEDRGYTNFGNFHEVPFVRSYLHLLGYYKRDEITCLQMAAKLRELYPEYYYRIIALYQKNKVPLFTSFYNDKAIDTEIDYHQLIAVSTNSFENNIVNSNTEKKEGGPNLSFLTNSLNYYSTILGKNINKQHFMSDCIAFSEKLTSVIKQNATVSEYYLYGRDLMSQRWYVQVFAPLLNFQHIHFVQTKGLHIIESSFNWAGLANKHYRVGVEYYERLDVLEGQFFNLVVPEIIGNKFLLYDIDELEKTVLERLSEPKNTNDLMAAMQQYFEEDVIENHYNVFSNFITKVVRQLILIKAIQPIYIVNGRREYY